MIDDLARAYRKVVRDKVQQSADFIVAGKASSWEDYKARCAEVAAFNRALEMFTDVVKTHGIEEANDD